jgi:spermidine/putrescine transport system permease protein
MSRSPTIPRYPVRRLNTLIVALVSTLIATCSARCWRSASRCAAQYGKGLEALIFAPMIIPDIVLAIALLSFFSMLNLTMGLLDHHPRPCVFNLAFVCSVVRARLKNFDWSIVEASADLGASSFTTFRRVTLPVIAPAVIAGALLAFTLSVDEFIIAFFTSGAGRSSITLPMQIYAMIRFGMTPEINALATIVMGVSSPRSLLSQRLNKEQMTANERTAHAAGHR